MFNSPKNNQVTQEQFQIIVEKLDHIQSDVSKLDDRVSKLDDRVSNLEKSEGLANEKVQSVKDRMDDRGKFLYILLGTIALGIIKIAFFGVAK